LRLASEPKEFVKTSSEILPKLPRFTVRRYVTGEQ
jgi:hypothetical protein